MLTYLLCSSLGGGENNALLFAGGAPHERERKREEERERERERETETQTQTETQREGAKSIIPSSSMAFYIDCYTLNPSTQEHRHRIVAQSKVRQALWVRVR